MNKKPNPNLADFDLIPKDEAAFLDGCLSAAETAALQRRLSPEEFSQLEAARALYQGLQAPKYQYRLMHTIEQIALARAPTPGVMAAAYTSDASGNVAKINPGATLGGKLESWWEGLSQELRAAFQLFTAAFVPVQSEGGSLGWPLPAGRASRAASTEITLPKGVREKFSVSAPRETAKSDKASTTDYITVTALKQVGIEMRAHQQSRGGSFFVIRGYCRSPEAEVIWDEGSMSPFTWKEGAMRYVAEVILPHREPGGGWLISIVCR